MRPENSRLSLVQTYYIKQPTVLLLHDRSNNDYLAKLGFQMQDMIYCDVFEV